jgi:CcmD family protein
MLTYMMVGYLVIWALAFAFILSMWSRSRRLEAELEAVRGMVDRLDQE